jgi:hypothetical protein
VANADGHDAIDPIILRGAGFEDRAPAEIVAAGIDRLAFVELFDDTGQTDALASARHHDQCAVGRLQQKPDVEFDARICAHGLSVIVAIVGNLFS